MYIFISIVYCVCHELVHIHELGAGKWAYTHFWISCPQESVSAAPSFWGCVYMGAGITCDVFTHVFLRVSPYLYLFLSLSLPLSNSVSSSLPFGLSFVRVLAHSLFRSLPLFVELFPFGILPFHSIALLFICESCLHVVQHFSFCTFILLQPRSHRGRGCFGSNGRLSIDSRPYDNKVWLHGCFGEGVVFFLQWCNWQLEIGTM